MSMLDNGRTHSAAPHFPRGVELLRDPLLNKGTAFTEQERDALGLRGLLPAHVLSMEEQAERMLSNLRRQPTDQLDRVVQFRDAVFVVQQAVRVAAAAHVDTDRRKSVPGEVAVSRRVVDRGAVTVRGPQRIEDGTVLS